ncbi:N-alpha-acetyltransferase 40 [Phytophthora boehmeriae]|uniref:N-alpha-acetyltransferase 40 n=1 Tax=Phytophthora boehmeriae TaxID=109152 RepID=A0A8T1WUJ9_9STRA|nr:N-alpha-acetyltransferase 40 [Phytophthora boehmeriae]
MSSPRNNGINRRRTTVGPQLLLKKNIFQGLVIPVIPLPQQQDIGAIVSEVLAKQLRLRKFQEFPRASRVRILASSDNNPSESKLAEESEDNALIGVGDRLLYLLQRWQVTNVVVVVAHRDDSLSARLLGGAELYKLATEAAKLALEQHYLDSVAEAAKVAAEVAAAEKANAPEAEQHREHLQQVIPATCVMSSNTVPTWPKNHHPTSDGGGRKGVKQGRINHFRYQEEKNQEAEQPERLVSENVAKLTSGGSLAWLGISREEWRKLRSIRVPVRELHYLFMCLVILLEPPLEQRGDSRKTKPTPKQQEQFVPSDFSWAHCRQVLHKSSEWSHRLRAVRGGTLAPSQVTALRAIFQEPSFNEGAFVRIAGGAGTKIFSWLQRLLDEYDEKDLGMLRIDMPSVPSVSATEDDTEPNRQQDNEVVKHEQIEEQGSPELRALRNVSKGPKSPSRKPFKIVDPGRLFGRHHATQ